MTLTTRCMCGHPRCRNPYPKHKWAEHREWCAEFILGLSDSDRAEYDAAQR